MITRNIRVCTYPLALAVASFSLAAQQDTQASRSSRALEEIVVTANKREQTINEVGLTIQSASGEALRNRGISDVGDLSKLVPGFVATQSTFATPVYTLRGIGLYDSTIGAAPAVAIYADEISRNFPMMSDALELDIERVEVLKGPQGTLFGQSSTGGAINYILNKPTDYFDAGIDLSYERFEKTEMAGFVSGPVADTLNARLAVKTTQGGAWQKSISRPHDENGDTNKTMGRLSLDWKPTDRVQIQTTVTAARDKSDTQAPQYMGSFYNIYSADTLAAANLDPATQNPYGYVNNELYALLVTPGSPGYRPDHVANQAIAARRLNGVDGLNAFRPELAEGAAAILGSEARTRRNRDADWTPGFLRGARNHYRQGTIRADVELTEQTMLTIVSAYAKSKMDRTIDIDGTTAQSLDIRAYGSIEAFNQEIRLSGSTDRTNWIVGLNYDYLKTADHGDYTTFDYIGNDPLSWAVTGLGPLQDFNNHFETSLKTYAAFANVEFEVTDKLSVSGGIRYTENRQKATYCHNDPGGVNLGANDIFGTFSQLFGAPADFSVAPGECFALGPVHTK